jgi:hypothetical protein
MCHTKTRWREIMKVEYDLNSPTFQNEACETPASSDKTTGTAQGSPGDKIIISDEAREALSRSTDDVKLATELIEKFSSSYPEKDLVLKINEIEIEATEPKPFNKLGGLIVKFLSGIIR